MRTVNGLVLLVPNSGDQTRTMMVGPGGFLEGNNLEVFSSLDQAQAYAADSMNRVQGQPARLMIGMAEEEPELALLSRASDLIVISRARDRIDNQIFYQFYGAIPPGQPANTTVHASYLGTHGWHTFPDFQRAEETAREVNRQMMCPVTIARFFLTPL